MSSISGSNDLGGLVAFFKALTPQAKDQADKTAAAAAAKRTGQAGSSSSAQAGSQDPTDTIETSPQAKAILSAIPSLTAQGNEQQKEQDKKDLKAETDQLHLLEILSGSLPPEKRAKELTDLAKKIAATAADFAQNSGPAGSAASPATAGSSDAAAVDGSAQSGTASGASAGGASDAAKSSAGTADRAAADPSAAADATAGGSTATGAAGTSTDSAASSADGSDVSAAGFFSEVIQAFKKLKELETRAISQLAGDRDPKKKAEARKFGSEFNDAVASVRDSATAAGVSNPEINDLPINVPQATLSIT